MDSNEAPKRQVVLDTETTGIHEGKPVYLGHYVIEIGAVEILHRKITRRFQRYVRAPRPSSPASFAVHGITEAMLEGQPTFQEVAQDFIEFIRGAELIIHNAPFDIGFLNQEFSRIGYAHPDTQELPFLLENWCPVVDTLKLARKRFPGRRNNLNALCERYQISLSGREKHGALLDAELLAQVYLKFTSGQVSLEEAGKVIDPPRGVQGTHEASNPSEAHSSSLSLSAFPLQPPRASLPIIRASAPEVKAHEACLSKIKKIYAPAPLALQETDAPCLETEP